MLNRQIAVGKKLRAAEVLRGGLFSMTALGLVVVPGYVNAGWWFIPFALGVGCLGFTLFDTFVEIIHPRLREYNRRHLKAAH